MCICLAHVVFGAGFLGFICGRMYELNMCFKTTCYLCLKFFGL